MKEKLKKQKGITLIALIISIIVMLILAMVSINIIMNQGIMTKSKTASDTHQVAAEKEAIQLGYTEYLNDKYNGETNPTLTVADANVQESENEWTITFNAEPKNVYKLSKNGGEPDGPLTGGNAGGNGESITDEEMQAVLQSFTANPQNYAHSEQSSTNKDRAIGTDGKAVNMDLWGYRVINIKEIELNTSYIGCAEGSCYSNKDIVDGKIKGTVPQYIYIEEKNEVYPVTSMHATFGECTDLIESPIIPSTVKNMQGTFHNCTKLIKAPIIPNSVTDLSFAFLGCSNLLKTPEIPSTVTDMYHTFSGCTSLTGTVRINASNINSVSNCFYDITNIIIVRVPENSITYNTFNEEYKRSFNIVIKTPDEELEWWRPTEIENTEIIQVGAGYLIATNELGSDPGLMEVYIYIDNIEIVTTTEQYAKGYYYSINGEPIYGNNVEPNKWYCVTWNSDGTQTFEQYNGPFPISKELFTQIYSESYLDRIIASFE